MTGLELILDKIIKDAEKIADENIAKAKEQAQSIDSEYADEMKAVSEQEAKNREDAVNLLLERAKSEKTAFEREMLLAEEQKTAKEIIEMAKNRILQMPKDEYFAYLVEIFKNRNDFKEGEILLCKEDRENMPEDFVKNLDANLTLSSDDAPEKGFIVRQGRVELNCTFDAIFRELESKLYDIACCKE